MISSHVSVFLLEVKTIYTGTICHRRNHKAIAQLRSRRSKDICTSAYKSKFNTKNFFASTSKVLPFKILEVWSSRLN